MHVLWRVANESNYIDYSEVLSKPNGDGWDKLIERFQSKYII